MKRVAVLVSGGGTNLQALLESERRGENPDGKITLVIASKPGVYALERAANFGVESAVVSRKEYADSADFDAALLGVLQAHDIDVVVLAGFLSVLGEKVIAAYRNRILNVHPSLIPSFCGPGFYGLKVHEAALARGVKLTGATVTELNLVTSGSIPADAGALLINAPGADLTDAEAALLNEYVANGGKLFVTTDFTTATPKLDSVLAACGMNRQPGLLIETDADHYPYGYPQTYLLPTVVNNEITAGVSQSMMVYTPIAQGITTDEDSEFTFTQLLTTGDTAYAMENYATAETAQKADTDPEGSFAVAVAAENAATGARVVWVNCPNLLLSSINQQVSGGNAQLLGSAVNWLNGAQTTAVINAKSMSAASLNVPVSAAVPLGVLFTLVLPIVCLIAGAVICVVRRRR